MKILVLNAGSSTQKSALFKLEPDASPDPLSPEWEGRLEWDGEQESLVIRNSQGQEIRNKTLSDPKNRQSSVRKMLVNVWSGPAAVLSAPSEIAVAGHRIVHGGSELTQPVVVDSQVKKQIAAVAEIAPLHNQAGLSGIELTEELLPGTRQVAVFDTGFHRTLPQPVAVYPGPYAWYESGIRRYGFHGINHEYCAHRAAHMLRRDLSSLKIISCHLGNGCSLAAIDGGQSVDTTMGFTPLEGLMMGTRSGSIDPGILTHLMRVEGVSGNELNQILNQQSGLLGISGVSSDMRDIVKAMGEGSQQAKLAFEMFVHRLRAGIGAMAASLGGLDALAFTAGIGENSAEVRQAACAKVGFLGIELDEARNSSVKPDGELSRDSSRARVLVIRAQEDWCIARACARLA